MIPSVFSIYIGIKLISLTKTYQTLLLCDHKDIKVIQTKSTLSIEMQAVLGPEARDEGRPISYRI